MIPELSAVYGLSPRDVWDLTQSEYSAFIRHHDEMVRESKRGR